MSEAKKNQEWWCVDFGQAELLDPETFQALAESFLRFTPDVVVGRNRLFLEMGRTRHLFQLNTLTSRARVLAERVGLDSTYWKWGVGQSIPESWVQTRYRTRLVDTLPLEAYYDFIDPLSHFEMNRAMNERVLIFRSLGLKTLSGLFEIPKEAWLVRFGEEFDTFLEHFSYPKQFAWVRLTPSLKLTEKTHWNAEEYVIDSEGLIFRLKPLIDRICERLYALRRALKKIELVLELDRTISPDRTIELSFAFPQTSRVLLLKLLREKLSRVMEREPLTDPIIAARVEVTEVVKREHTNARFAFSEADAQLSDETERWLELISYLGLKVSDPSQVFQAETTEHPLPEKSWKKVLLQEPRRDLKLDQVSHLYAERPVRLLTQPLPLFRLGPYLRRERELWRICDVSHEEVIEAHAWDVELQLTKDDEYGFARTYYKVHVRSQAGQEQFWWIYKDERLGELKLHGVY